LKGNTLKIWYHEPCSIYHSKITLRVQWR
jgi:hypothetical protein